MNTTTEMTRDEMREILKASAVSQGKGGPSSWRQPANDFWLAEWLNHKPSARSQDADLCARNPGRQRSCITKDLRRNDTLPRNLPRIGPAQARESVRSITCVSRLFTAVKDNICRDWRRGVNTRTLATIYRIPRLEVEAVLYERHTQKNVVEFPGPKPTAPVALPTRKVAEADLARRNRISDRRAA